MKKIIVLFLFTAILFSLMVFALTGSANRTSTYVLYKNDTKFSFSEYPAINIEGELYVPSSFFIGFKNILYEYSQKYESFYFMNTQTGRYFAFSFNTDSIILDGVYTQKLFPIRNSTIYMPLEYCADILSLGVETYVEDSVEYKRLTDGTQSLDFIELIELFDPAGRLEPSPPDDPVNPPDNPPPIDIPPVENPTQKTVYLMLALDEPHYAEEMINTLKAFGEQATIFFTKEVLLKEPKEVYHALIDGNGIGVWSQEENPDEIKEAENVLSLLTNQASRICLSSDDASLNRDGFITWTPTIDADSYSTYASYDAAVKIYEEALLHERVSIKLRTNTQNNNLLLALVGLFANDKNVKLAIIDSSVPDIIF